MNADLRNLISLQDIDQKIASLKKHISEVPDKVRTLHEELVRLIQAHQARVGLNQDLAKQRRARESDVDMMRTKLSRLKDQLMTVKTNREYTVMLHEIESAEEQIRVAEDGILDVMEQMEAMEGDLADSDRALATRKEELDREIKNAEDAAPRMESEVARLGQVKTDLEAIIGADLLGRYHRIADARKGIALAEAKNELCSACHVRIRPQVYAELLRTDEIHVCDSCSRILFLREGDKA